MLKILIENKFPIQFATDYFVASFCWKSFFFSLNHRNYEYNIFQMLIRTFHSFLNKKHEYLLELLLEWESNEFAGHLVIKLPF